MRFTNWSEAHTYAVTKAKECSVDFAIRFVREFGKGGYNVSIASHNDSDYSRAEIVRPNDPLTAEVATTPVSDKPN